MTERAIFHLFFLEYKSALCLLFNIIFINLCLNNKKIDLVQNYKLFLKILIHLSYNFGPVFAYLQYKKTIQNEGKTFVNIDDFVGYIQP